MAQNAKQLTARTPRTWEFNTLGYLDFAPFTDAAGTVAVTTISQIVPIPVSCKISKVGVAWLASTDATPSFNIVYNTIQSGLSSSQAYTASNVAPNDNSYAYGQDATLTNAALTTAFPQFVQKAGLGIPTNVAVDGQPLFAANVVINTTNFPGASATTGGSGILIPTNFDAVYPAGPYPYGVAQGMTNAANIPAFFSLRVADASSTITGLTITLFVEPITLWEKAPVDSTGIERPGVTF